MNTQNANEKKFKYKFRGKTLLVTKSLVRELNYALALNRCSDRYEIVK